MAWGKFSDTAPHHPLVTRVLTVAEWPERLTNHDCANLLWGLISRAALMSAGHTTDYGVTAGTLANLAGDNWRHWAALAVRIGYLTPVDVPAGEEEAWQLVEDSEGLFHLRKRAELDWERARRRDTSDPSLTIPVRLRDGDGCRYCGCIVNWRARRGGRAGTYDHRVPGQRAQGPDDLRVSCAGCNGRRGAREDAEQFMPPLPPPAEPFYGDDTFAMLTDAGHQVRLSHSVAPGARPPARPRSKPSDPAASRAPQITPRPGRQPDTAPATPPPAEHRTPRPRNTRDTAPEQREHRSADPADHRYTAAGNPGRDGSGRVGLRPGPGPGARSNQVPPPDTSTKRRTRGRRGRPTQPDKDTP